MAASKLTPGQDLLRLPCWLAAAVLAFNDFWLKPHHPGWLSGKLSDFAIMVLLPAALVSAAEWTAWLLRRPRRLGPKGRTLAVVVSGVYLASLQLSPWFEHLHLSLMRWATRGRPVSNTADVTDLLALIVLPAVWWMLMDEPKAPDPPSNLP